MSETAPATQEDPLRLAAREVAQHLLQAGYQAWLVGGCVRDRLLGEQVKDIDIATDAHPDEAVRIFPNAQLVGKSFGVCVVPHRGFQIEVAAFRRDGRYFDHRHPDFVDYGTIEDDVARRDFTINALYEHPITGEIRDFAGGKEDLQRRILRCVGEPHRRFNEDALRLLRAVRFAARFSLTIEPETWQAMIELAPTIDYISPERQREELDAILRDPNAAKALRLMDGCGLLHFLLPEVEAMKGIEQGAEMHPEGDVFEHTLLVVEKVEPRNTINVWAALLHDVGKPVTFEKNPETGKITFYDHQTVGGMMARRIMENLRFPARTVETVEQVIRRHMTFQNVQHMRKSTMRRFLGASTAPHDLAVHRADCLGSSGRMDYYNFCLDKLAEFHHEGEEALPPPLITGNDLIALGVPQGPRIGALLEQIQEKQLEGELRTREEALAHAETLIREAGE